MGAAVECYGLGKLRRDLRKLGDDLSDLKDANARVSRFVARVAAERGPKRTGRLTASVRGSRQVRRARVAAGGARVPYAGPIHWGWPARKIEAQPFVSKAAQSTEPQWLPFYAADVARQVDKLAGRRY